MTRPTSRYSIGQAAAASGVSAKMIRYYEAIGLVRKPARTAAGYRAYGQNDVHTLRFVRRARALGFSMAQVGELLSLWQDRSRRSASVHRLATRHIEELNSKIAELDAMVQTLKRLAQACHGDMRPECPILDDLARPAGAIRRHRGGRS